MGKKELEEQIANTKEIIEGENEAILTIRYRLGEHWRLLKTFKKKLSVLRKELRELKKGSP